MKFSYKFSNLLGTIYGQGNLCFTPDGNSVISPVGNKLTIYDLKNNKAKTLALESLYNYTSIALSPNGNILLASNEHGQCQMISMVSCTVIYKHKFKCAIQLIEFSPDGMYFAVAVENVLLIFKTPGEISGEYSPFLLAKKFLDAYDDITWVTWSSDSRFLAIGSRDNSTKICSIKLLNNFRTYLLGGHTEGIVGCFFENNSLHLNTISRNGQLCIWECSVDLHQITDKVDNIKQEDEEEPPKRKPKTNVSESDDEKEDDVDEENAIEKNSAEQMENGIVDKDENAVKNEDEKKRHPFFYKKIARHYLANEPRKEQKDAYVTSTNYNKKTKILVVAFSSGAFYLYELPEVNMIHSLSISEYPITSVCFNIAGDWLALASSALGQLLVWEWQSEQYIMKQQGHMSEMNCITYSPDGQVIASGGEDSKVKLWNVNNGFCFVTFHEHQGGITGIEFSSNKKFLVSSSLDGTVRAYDIIRYRNFRTFTSPTPVQFSCVAIDFSGELVVAGGLDFFEIYLWSIKLGKLLEIISGHEGPVCSVAFSPNPISTTLVSGSWDKTLKIWNCLENDSQHETIEMLSDVTCIAFSPSGEEVAVATLSGSINFFDVKTSQQITSIEGRNDLGSGVSDVDVISAKKNLQGKCFTSITYSADGECILAGGKSQNVCIYNVREGILLKKFEITQNHSFDGMNEYINRRHITEFGNMALIEERENLEGGNVAIRLPGVQKGDMATRNYKPEIRVFCVKFSPNGQQWSAACTEGLLIYSLDKGVVFDPFNLSLEVTPKATRECLRKKEYLKAIIMSVKLNEPDLIEAVLEACPERDIELISSSLANEYAERVLLIVSKLMQSTPHIEFYLKWSCSLLTHHGNKENVFQHQTLLSLHESLSRKYESINKICDFNKYTLKILIGLSEDSNSKGKDGPNNICEINDNNAIENDENDDYNMILVKSTDYLNGDGGNQTDDSFTENEESD